MELSLIDKLQFELDDVSLRLKQLEDAKIRNEDFTAKDIIYLTNRINDLEYRISELKKHEPRRVVSTSQQYVYNPDVEFNKRVLKHDITLPTTDMQNMQFETRSKGYKLSEANVGKYIIGILASVLILLAAGVFIGTIWHNIPYELKFMLLLGLGISIQSLGYFRLKRTDSSNGFWSSVMGLGSAIVYTVIMSGCLAWGMYSDVIFGILALAWFGANFMLAKRISSRVYYVIDYIGGVVTIILAAVKLSTSSTPSIHDQISLGIMMYTVIAFGLYSIHKEDIKNMLTIKILNFLFMGFSILTLEGYFLCYVNVKAYIAAILQFSIGFIAMYLASSIKVKVGTEVGVDIYGNIYKKSRIKEIWTCVLVHVTLLAVVIGVENITVAIARTRDFENYKDFVNLGRMLASIIILLTIAIQIMLNMKHKERIIMASGTMALLYAGAMSGYMFNDVLIFITLLNLAVYALYRKGHLEKRATVYIYMIATLFYYNSLFWDVIKQSGKWSLLLNFLLISTIFIHAYYNTLSKTLNNISSTSWICTKTTAFILVPFSISYTIMEAFDLELVYILSVFTFTWILHILYTINKYRNLTSSTDKGLSTFAYVIIMAAIHITCYIYSIFTNVSIEMALISLIIIALSCMSIYNSIKFRSLIHTILVVLVSNFNIVVISYMWGSRDTMLIISVLGILLSSIFIILGFKIRQKELRVLGLISVITYVIKIVIIDVSLMHGGEGKTIIMLLVGGLLCYGISFMYNKLDQMYGEDKKELE